MASSQSIPAALGAENLFNVKDMIAVVTGGGTGQPSPQPLAYI